ncbi:MAG TPA: hypothetical protein VLD19_16555, partial [Chitinophagaceae bacterium]|nr:hypothetical protein [Chitinophagaceae bacterium]
MQNRALLYSIAGGLFVMITLVSFNPVDNTGARIVLRISKVCVTEYELEKNLAFFSDDFVHKNGYSPAAPDITNWIQSFIDRTYFLADAYEKGYDTLSELNGWVQSMEHYVISQKGGLLDQKMDSAVKAPDKPAMQAARYDQVKKEAQIKINPDVLPVLEIYLKDKKNIRKFDKSSFTRLLPVPLFTYHIDGRSIDVSASRFMDYYNTLPIRKEIKTIEELIFYTESMVYDAFAYRKAEELGITKELKFILDRENYKKNVVWASYETKELRNGITVSDAEIIARYREIKDSLVQATDIVVSSYSFAARRDALIAMMAVKNSKTDSITNGKVIDHHRHINYRDVFFSDSTRAVVFAMKNNDMSMPVPFNGNFVVIVKDSESGRRIKEMPEVKYDI